MACHLKGWSSRDGTYLNAAQWIGEVIKAVRRELIEKPVVLTLTASSLPRNQSPGPCPEDHGCGRNEG